MSDLRNTDPRLIALGTARSGASADGGVPYGAPRGAEYNIRAALQMRVLRNTYALLGLTLLFAAGIAMMSASMGLPYPGILFTLAAYFGLLFAIHKLRSSAWSIALVFALTGFMGYTLGPIVSLYAGLPGGGQIIGMALGSTAITFIGLSAYVLATRKDFSFLGGMLFVGMLVAIVASLAAVFLHLPGMSVAISAAVALLSSGYILLETSRIVNGGETNYVLATVSLFVALFNLFVSLLQLFGFAGRD